MVNNVDAIDQMRPKMLVASVVFSMAEYIFILLLIWNMITGLVIRPVIRILKIVGFVLIVLSIISSSTFRNVIESSTITSSLPDEFSYFFFRFLMSLVM